LNGSIRTIRLSNNAPSTYRANTISSIDLNAPGKSYTTITSLDLSNNGSLSSISNLGLCTSLISLKVTNCLFTNTNQILTTNNLSLFPTLSTLELNGNNFGSNFTLTFAGTQLTQINLQGCGLTTTVIDDIINGLASTSLNGVTLKLENLNNSNFLNCGRSSNSNTSFGTLIGVTRNFTITLTQNPTINTTPFTSNSTISVSWVAVTTPSGTLALTGYEIRWKRNIDTDFNTPISLGIVTTYSITGLIALTLYNVQVRSKFGTGSSTVYSCWSTQNFSTSQ
jgi:hypothetical protein